MDTEPEHLIKRNLVADHFAATADRNEEKLLALFSPDVTVYYPSFGTLDTRSMDRREIMEIQIEICSGDCIENFMGG
jgi:hypothetical protein